ncbi:MAG: glucoamylase family protein, partial [Geminicoccaceae bacterium]
ALIRTGSPGPSASDPVPAPKKDAWEQALGGKEAARPHLAARLSGWPEALLVAPPAAEVDDRAFLMRLARDTWRGIAELTDREHGLPIDRVGFPEGSIAPAQSRVGDYTGPSTIGLYLMSIAAAKDLGFIDEGHAVARLERALSTLKKLERFQGFFYNYYDTTSLERTTNFISSLDSAWLTAGLMVLREAFPELRERSTRLIEETDYGWLYDDVKGLLSHGYYVNLRCPSEYHYGLLYTEARVLSLIAIGKGDVPERHWSRLMRTFPAAEAWQSQQPRGGAPASGYYEHAGYRYVPSWGGSMFEALMPTLVIDESAAAPESLGPNDRIHAILQRRYALDELGYPVWGMSPSATVNGDGYGEFGVWYLGTLGYPSGVVTPHASALALAVTPEAAIVNLRKLASLPGLYGPYGFYDAVDPTSGQVSHRYLTLDQEMLFLALANHLDDHVVQRTFASDPIAARALPILGQERFFDHDGSSTQAIR